jgi:Skp family chaperone for outer membrane proteins
MKLGSVLSLVIVSVALSLFGSWGLLQLASPASSGSVAVIDLNRVAQQLGRDQEIADALKSNDAQLVQQLAQYQSQLKQQLEDKKSQQQAASSDDQTSRVQLASYAQGLNQQLVKARSTAAQSLQNHRRQLVLKFREEVSPFAISVARERRLGVVVVKTDDLLTHDSQIDITDEVAERMLAAAGK